MKELREIVKSYDQATQQGRKTALAAVVHLDGSSYRRPGARMLVSDEGEMTGAISGGCLEGDALRKALLVLSQQHSKLVTYDTSDEDDATIGIQLGCAGVIQVLFEPLDPANPNNPAELMRKHLQRRQESVFLTLFHLNNRQKDQPGTCLLLESNHELTGHCPIPELEAELLSDMKQVLASKKSAFRQYILNNETITAFIEYLQPPLSLIVVGAGNDAIPLMQIADTLGWEVSVVDGRNTHAKPERFAAACQVLVSKPEKVLEKLVIDARTAFVMMTHNYNYDLAMLKALLPLNAPYIGLLGPLKKRDRMLDELREGGMQITTEMMDKVYGPTGLEIGAETAEEIALSIVAEIQAVFNGKNGSSLRQKNDVIHSRLDTLIEQKSLN